MNFVREYWWAVAISVIGAALCGVGLVAQVPTMVAVGAMMLAPAMFIALMFGTGFALFLVGTALRWLFSVPIGNRHPLSPAGAPPDEYACMSQRLQAWADQRKQEAERAASREDASNDPKFLRKPTDDDLR